MDSFVVACRLAPRIIIRRDDMYGLITSDYLVFWVSGKYLRGKVLVMAR